MEEERTRPNHREPYLDALASDLQPSFWSRFGEHNYSLHLLLFLLTVIRRALQVRIGSAKKFRSIVSPMRSSNCNTDFPIRFRFSFFSLAMSSDTFLRQWLTEFAPRFLTTFRCRPCRFFFQLAHSAQ